MESGKRKLIVFFALLDLVGEDKGEERGEAVGEKDFMIEEVGELIFNSIFLCSLLFRSPHLSCTLSIPGKKVNKERITDIISLKVTWYVFGFNKRRLWAA